MGRPPMEVKVYEEDSDGNEFENKNKSYKLEQIQERIGCFINLDEKFYTAEALLKYEENR